MPAKLGHNLVVPPDFISPITSHCCNLTLLRHFGTSPHPPKQAPSVLAEVGVVGFATVTGQHVMPLYGEARRQWRNTSSPPQPSKLKRTEISVMSSRRNGLPHHNQCRRHSRVQHESPCVIAEEWTTASQSIRPCAA